MIALLLRVGISFVLAIFLTERFAATQPVVCPLLGFYWLGSLVRYGLDWFRERAENHARRARDRARRAGRDGEGGEP